MIQGRTSQASAQVLLDVKRLQRHLASRLSKVAGQKIQANAVGCGQSAPTFKLEMLSVVTRERVAKARRRPNIDRLLVMKATWKTDVVGNTSAQPLPRRRSTGARVVRIADGPDEVHRIAIAKMEIGKYA